MARSILLFAVFGSTYFRSNYFDFAPSAGGPCACRVQAQVSFAVAIQAGWGWRHRRQRGLGVLGEAGDVVEHAHVDRVQQPIRPGAPIEGREDLELVPGGALERGRAVAVVGEQEAARP